MDRLFFLGLVVMVMLFACHWYFARMANRRKPHSSQCVDVPALARRVVRGFERQVAPRGVRLQLHVEPARLDAAADETWLANALWSLLDGAVKYSAGTKWVHVFVRRRGTHVVIGVQDRGTGIPGARQRELVLPMSA